MNSPVDNADPHPPEPLSPETRPGIRTTRRAVGATVMGAVISALTLLVAAESAAARVPYSVVASEADTRTTSQTPAPAPSPTPAPTTSPTPTPTPTAGTTHEQQNGERRVQRDDLGLLGVVFLVGIGFILALGATGVVFAGRARRRRDRATQPEPSDET
ncbi:hypothetical protein [Microbacterium sp. NPDC091662]|uniref:hypothetical protein n=1 Tax=Microbacterium sp. NPDC091662 TaxID=3364211 RepID=UPI00381A484C